MLVAVQHIPGPILEVACGPHFEPSLQRALSVIRLDTVRMDALHAGVVGGLVLAQRAGKLGPGLLDISKPIDARQANGVTKKELRRV